ncbi:MAG TPA: hypothetical protein VKU85_06975, partial [bacterium]|nr:hypothetical protein [bacterium]
MKAFALRTLFVAALLAAGALPRPAAAATNVARAGLNGIANGTIQGGDGTGSAVVTINPVTLSLVKQARDVTGAVLPDGAGVLPGQELWFVLFTDNPTAAPAQDVRMLDVLDEQQFAFVPGTLAECTVPSGSGDAAIWAGSWTPATDALGVPDDVASAMDTGGLSAPDRVTAGAVSSQSNVPLGIPAGSLRAVRFRVRVVPSVVPGQTLTNAASGANGPAPLDASSATVTLTVAGGVASQATAEITPAEVAAGTRPRLDYWTVATVGPGDSGVQALEITVPAGWSNPGVVAVEVDGAPLASACPAALPGEYCATVVGSVLRIDLSDRLTMSGQRLRVGFRADAPASAGEANFAGQVVAGTATLVATPGDADGAPGNSDGIRVRTVATQGIVLDLDVLTDRPDVVVGEPVTVTVPIRNLTATDVSDAVVHVDVPPHFRAAGEARLDGAPVAATETARSVRFDVGTVAARSDTDGNGQLDPGEPGYRTLAFRLVAGSGAAGEQRVRVHAVDTCDDCAIAEEAEADLRVRADPDFERGTVIGKVFRDADGDGRQGPGEEGIGHARVVLDDGTVAVTDAHGRYSLPFTAPGQRLIKVDLASVGPGARATDDESRIVRVTPGLLVKANFGVALPAETVRIGHGEVEGVALVSLADDHGIEVLGNVGMLTVLVNGTKMVAPTVDVAVTSRPGDPVRFALRVEDAPRARAWSLAVHGGDGAQVHRIDGAGAPPASLTWDGAAATCRLEVEYEDGVRVGSASRTIAGAPTLSAEPAA